MVLALKVLTAASVAGLAIFMMVMGYISLVFAPVMLAWNAAPLVTACVIAARASRSIVPIAMIAFATGYVGVAALIYYDWFFLEAQGMDGFAYLFVPIIGWLGFLTGKAIETWVALGAMVLRR